MAILNKYDLVCYIYNNYKEKYNCKITPIKLQKSLYLLYSFWGKKINVAKESFDVKTGKYLIEDKMILKYDENLFDAHFEAWSHGPVDVEVNILYKEKNIKIIDFEKNNLNVDNFIKEYIDYLLIRIFLTNDFALIDLTCDDAWKEAYNGNKRIKNGLIIKI